MHSWAGSLSLDYERELRKDKIHERDSIFTLTSAHRFPFAWVYSARRNGKAERSKRKKESWALVNIFGIQDLLKKDSRSS